MKKIFIEDLQGMTGEVLGITGWIHKIQKLKTAGFFQLRDATGLVQVVCDPEVAEALRLETPVEVVGQVVGTERQDAGVEIHLHKIEVLAEVAYDLLPFSINGRTVEAGLEKQLDVRTMSLRRPRTRDVFRIEQEIVTAFRDFLIERRFSEIHTPKIIDAATEGGSEVFTVDYFGQRAFLAQSPQFYKQMMVGAGFERVFEVGHAYRAELHATQRHLNEYVSLDVEMGFLRDEKELMDLEESLLFAIFDRLEVTCQTQLNRLCSIVPERKSFPRIPMSQAKERLEAEGIRTGVTLNGAQEKRLGQIIEEETGSPFYFLTEYPLEKRPVYTYPGEDQGTSRSFDLIFRGMEITTGGQRIHQYQDLYEGMVEAKMDPQSFGFYLDSFRYGMPPHGGFAIGLERLTMQLLKLDNIRQATLLPRDLHRLTP